MTDLENRVWLCGEVMSVLREGGMSAERALAMLHAITDVQRPEPYLSDAANTAVDWPDVSGADTVLHQNGVQWTVRHSGDGLVSDLPLIPKPGELSSKTCAICDDHLRRRPKETEAQLLERETCSLSHAAQYREQKRRRDRIHAALDRGEERCAVPI